MPEFRWHLTTEARPREGKGNYVIIGPKGGMYFVTEYVVLGEKYRPGEWFKDTRGIHHYLDEVKAWAEIPPFGSDDTCHDVGDARFFHCSECGFGLEDVYLSDESYFLDDDNEFIDPWPPFCPNCGRRVVDES